MNSAGEPPEDGEGGQPEASSPARERLAAALRRCQESLERAELANGELVARELGATARARAAEAELGQRVGRLEAEVSTLRSELEAMRASRSWRLTQPLRAATTAIRRLAGRS